MEEKGEQLTYPARGAGLERTQFACIKNTELERVAIKFKNEHDEYIRRERSQLQVFRAIASVYYFARTEMHIPYQPLVLEEYHVIRQHLRKMAEREIAEAKPKRRFWLFGRLVEPAKEWRYYLQHDCFPSCGIPGLSDWDREEWEKGLYVINTETERQCLQSAMRCLQNAAWLRRSSKFFFPPNYQELATALLKELMDGRHLGTLREHAGE